MKKEFQQKNEIALLYYMQGVSQKEIAAKVGISEQTLCDWVKRGQWEAKRAGASVTRQELVNKSLMALNRILDQVYQSDDVELVASLPDKLSKFAAAIEKLDKKSNIVTSMDTFMLFTTWLSTRAASDRDLSPELIALITRYQDLYVTEHMSIRH